MGITRRRAIFRLGAVVAAAAVVIFLSRVAIIQAVGDVLVRDDRPQRPAQYVALLMGDITSTRADTALRLYRAGLAKKILFAQVERSGFVAAGLVPSDTEAHAAYLSQKGVPGSDIIIVPECTATSTYTEAKCLLGFLTKQAGLDHVIVTTSWYHSSRAGWLFDHVFTGSGIRVEIAPAVGPASAREGWWRSEPTFLAVFNEYLKWTYWLGQVFIHGR